MQQNGVNHHFPPLSVGYIKYSIIDAADVDFTIAMISLGEHMPKICSTWLRILPEKARGGGASE